MKQSKDEVEELIFETIDKSKILTIPAKLAKTKKLLDIGIDSLHLISLSMLLEEELRLKIDLDNITLSSTLSDLIDELRPIS